jgi:hypothetical protein
LQITCLLYDKEISHPINEIESLFASVVYFIFTAFFALKNKKKLQRPNDLLSDKKKKLWKQQRAV